MTWPSSYAEGTRGYMIDRIDDELKKSGAMNTQIAACISAAIAIYQKERFRFSESRSVCVFNTVAAQEFYTSSDNAAIATLFAFDYVTALIGATEQDELIQLQPKDMELLSQNGTQSGQPTHFSYMNYQIRLYPVPDNVYQIRVAGHMSIAAPASDSEAGNKWMTDAERLIRSRAKYELALNYGVGGGELLAMMNPDTGATYDAFCTLKRETAKITGTGRVRPTQF